MQSQQETLQIGLMNKFNQNLAMFFFGAVTRMKAIIVSTNIYKK